MTYHDEVFEGFEIVAYDSIYNLQLWLNTIAGLDFEISNKITQDLNELCETLGWELEYEDQLGINMLPKRGTVIPEKKLGYRMINSLDIDVFLSDKKELETFVIDKLYKEIYNSFSNVKDISMELIDEDTLMVRIEYDDTVDIDYSLKEFNAFWYDWYYENSNQFQKQLIVGI